MAAELIEFGVKVSDILSGAAVGRIVNKAGMAGKKAALHAAAQDLGPDRRMSGFRRRSAALNAGYDAGLNQRSVVINFRPAGLWTLASQGRRSSGTIRPKRKRAVTPAPGEARASSRYGRSRGLDTYQDAVKKAVDELTKAQHKVAEVLYRQQQASSDAPGGEQAKGAGAGASGGGSGAGDGDVIDAEVVDEKK